MLELAIVIDLALGKWLEAGVIATLLVGNAVTGAVQERRAKTADAEAAFIDDLNRSTLADCA